MEPRMHGFIDEGLGHSSYVIDLGDGTAAVVDPPRFPDAHQHLCDQLGLRLAWTIDTHSHADYVTGSPGLVRRIGATFIASWLGWLVTPDTPLVFVLDADQRRGGLGLQRTTDRDHSPGPYDPTRHHRPRRPSGQRVHHRPCPRRPQPGTGRSGHRACGPGPGGRHVRSR